MLPGPGAEAGRAEGLRREPETSQGAAPLPMGTSGSLAEPATQHTGSAVGRWHRPPGELTAEASPGLGHQKSPYPLLLRNLPEPLQRVLGLSLWGWGGSLLETVSLAVHTSVVVLSLCPPLPPGLAGHQGLWTNGLVSSPRQKEAGHWLQELRPHPLPSPQLQNHHPALQFELNSL